VLSVRKIGWRRRSHGEFGRRWRREEKERERRRRGAYNGEDANFGLSGAFSSSPASHELVHADGYVPGHEKRREGGQTAHDGEQPEKLLLSARHCSKLTGLFLPLYLSIHSPIAQGPKTKVVRLSKVSNIALRVQE
jgi:hypothetical protein